MTNEEYEEKLAQMIEYTKEYLIDYIDLAPDTEDSEILTKYYKEAGKKREETLDAGFKLLRELFETLWD